HEEQHASLARDAALLAVHSFQIPPRITDAWLSAPLTQQDARGWLQNVARLSRQNALVTNDDITRPPAFSSALMLAVFGDTRADTLLNSADVEYLLSFRDAADIPQQNRADVAMLLRDGFLALYPDATLRPREPLTRARAIRTIALLLDSRGNFQLQKGTTRPTANGALIVRSTRNHDQPIQVSADAYLFRSFGDNSYPARSLVIVGGEPVAFHVNASGDVDFLEVKPAPNGAAADHYSPFSNWTVQMSLAEAQQRLRQVNGIFGNLRDLRVAARGSSRRAIDLEIVGTSGTAHLRGGRIRSILGLREQLFVIDRRYDDAGHIIDFTFTGRGWGHGVGMCQVGAFGLARIGWSYERILKNYYTGIELTKLY
ncbi:MAG TPA: S-layer homology domain-containing protein, partial [Pyrinomonadaceae bacterium]|nr:S-layer homology domain-containing protein [Pyrinomonadaceae bacterium]